MRRYLFSPDPFVERVRERAQLDLIDAQNAVEYFISEWTGADVTVDRAVVARGLEAGHSEEEIARDWIEAHEVDAVSRVAA